MIGQFRLRVKYGKEGRGAYLSHLEVLRALDRIVRRAALPCAVSQGFNPHMKIAFGPALGVGVGSVDEYVDIYLTQFVHPDSAIAALQEATTEVMPVYDCEYVSPRLSSLSAAITKMTYCVDLTCLELTRNLEETPDAVTKESCEQKAVEMVESITVAEVPIPVIKNVLTRESLLTEAELISVEKFAVTFQDLDEIEVEQKGKMKKYVPAQAIDAPFTVAVDLSISSDADISTATFTLCATPTGMMRPETYLRLVFDGAGIDADQFKITRIESFISDKD